MGCKPDGMEQEIDPNQRRAVHEYNAHVAQLDRALDYEAEGCRFKSCDGHQVSRINL